MNDNFQKIQSNQEELIKNFEDNLQKNFNKLMQNIKDSDSNCSEDSFDEKKRNEPIQKKKVQKAKQKQKKIVKENLSHSEELEIVSKYSEPENSKGFQKVKTKYDNTQKIKKREHK